MTLSIIGMVLFGMLAFIYYLYNTDKITGKVTKIHIPLYINNVPYYRIDKNKYIVNLPINKKAMIITEETKLSDLIPCEYKLSSNELKISDLHIDMGDDMDQGLIKIRLKKKAKKDFEWYVENYMLKQCELRNPFQEHYIKFILGGLYFKISFEIKIGLLKFICESLYPKNSWIDILNSINCHLKSFKPTFNIDDIIEICPKDFLESIFK